MKGKVLSGWMILSLLCFSAAPVAAMEIVLNDSFEMQNMLYWEFTGTIPYSDRGVLEFDVTGNGQESWCFWSIPWEYGEGTLKQWIYVIAGVTYEVGMDVCYFAS